MKHRLLVGTSLLAGLLATSPAFAAGECRFPSRTSSNPVRAPCFRRRVGKFILLGRDASIVPVEAASVN